jgi:hypothetical protein
MICGICSFPFKSPICQLSGCAQVTNDHRMPDVRSFHHGLDHWPSRLIRTSTILSKLPRLIDCIVVRQRVRPSSRDMGLGWMVVAVDGHGRWRTRHARQSDDPMTWSALMADSQAWGGGTVAERGVEEVGGAISPGNPRHGRLHVKGIPMGALTLPPWSNAPQFPLPEPGDARGRLGASGPDRTRRDTTLLLPTNSAHSSHRTTLRHITPHHITPRDGTGRDRTGHDTAAMTRHHDAPPRITQLTSPHLTAPRRETAHETRPPVTTRHGLSPNLIHLATTHDMMRHRTIGQGTTLLSLTPLLTLLIPSHLTSSQLISSRQSTRQAGHGLTLLCLEQPTPFGSTT